MYFFLLFVS
uniref:Uncharacterized protein n=1 Tax=Anguilla anguilla TaxID=7936 RepID=A0A0E9SQB4_ANGAN